MKQKRVSLRSPAGNLHGVQKALAAGADVVYIGLSPSEGSGHSNLRNYEGLNFTPEITRTAVQMCHDQGKEMYIVINSYPQAKEMQNSFRSVDIAADLGVDSIVVSDISVMHYARTNHPGLDIHSSVQTGSANTATIQFYQEQFGVSCVVLPRVLTIPEVKEICQNTCCDIEVFAMGSLCTSFPGRCNLSQYITGESTNTSGICTSPQYLDFKEENDELNVSLNGITLNSFKLADLPSDLEICKKTGTGSGAVKLQNKDGWSNSFLVNKRHICKGRFCQSATKKVGNTLHDNVILDILPILPDLIDAGIDALKIEGRQRTSDYSGNSTKVLRQALDRYYDDPQGYSVEDGWLEEVSAMFAGMEHSTGSYLGR